MVLKRARRGRPSLSSWLPLARAAATTAACVLSFSLSACAPTSETPDGERKGLWGIRFDEDSGLRRKAVRAEAKQGDPCLAPSVKELREARAAAMIEADIMADGGLTRVMADGSSSNPGQVRFAAVPGALNLEITASDFLNNIDGQPHALTFVIYQLSDRLMFDQLTRTEEGVAKLLEGGHFDEAVKGVRRFFIQPGMQNRLSLDRAEGARHVALVAGYHNPPDPAAYMRIFSYGIGQFSTRGETRWHRSKPMFRPLPLNIRVDLGDTAMSAGETTAIFNNMRSSVTLRSKQYHAWAFPNEKVLW